MSIFNRSKKDKAESDKSSSEDSKTVYTPSDSVSDDESQQSAYDKKSKDKAPTKMDRAREVFLAMFDKDGIARKDIIAAFQTDRVKLTKAGAGTGTAKLTDPRSETPNPCRLRLPLHFSTTQRNAVSKTDKLQLIPNDVPN
jgi:hypothetical protein